VKNQINATAAFPHQKLSPISQSFPNSNSGDFFYKFIFKSENIKSVDIYNVLDEEKKSQKESHCSKKAGYDHRNISTKPISTNRYKVSMILYHYFNVV